MHAANYISMPTYLLRLNETKPYSYRYLCTLCLHLDTFEIIYIYFCFNLKIIRLTIPFYSTYLLFRESLVGVHVSVHAYYTVQVRYYACMIYEHGWSGVVCMLVRFTAPLTFHNYRNSLPAYAPADWVAASLERFVPIGFFLPEE